MKLRGFTIVELLVVIIVIAVLLSLSIVGYGTVSTRATVSSLRSDLTNAKKQLLAFQIQSSSNLFPSSINCVNPSATELCIRPSSPNTTFSYNVNNSSNPATFNLTATNGSTKYWINNTSDMLTSADIVTSGLVFHVDAGNPSSYPGSGTTWYDISGTGNNGSFVGNPTYSSQNAGALVFNGSSYVQFSDTSIPMGASVRTACAWIKTNAYTSSYGHILHWGFGSSGMSWGLAMTGGGSLLAHEWGVYQTLGFVPLNQWKFIAISLGSTGTKYHYIDGVSQGTTSYTPNTTSGNGLRVGSRVSTAQEMYNGYISQVTVYNRELTASEIQQNFNALRGRYGI